MRTLEIHEVGPRDGFQNIKEYIPIEDKLEIIDNVVAAGIRHIQHTSFVSPKAIPQMRDAAELTRICLERHPDVDFYALVPNLRGTQSAVENGLEKVSYVVSLSPTHNQANINRTHAESLGELEKIVTVYPDLAVCLDVATAFGCPFEGLKFHAEVVAFLKRFVDYGIRTINLCDTIGIANPKQVRETLAAVGGAYPEIDLMIHIHDTRNMGMVNTLAAIECGVVMAQSTLGGLGGCPFAPGASGNLATEDLAYMLMEMGYDLGIDFLALKRAAMEQRSLIPAGVYSGHHINIDAARPAR